MTTDLPRRRAAHSRRRFLAPLPAAAFAVLLGLTCAPPVQAAVTEEEPPELSLAAASRGVLRPGTALTTTLTIENVSDQALEGSTAVIELGRTPLDGREDLRAWLGGDDADVELTPIGSGTAEDVAPGETGTVGVTIAAGHDELGELGPGVYPLRARFDGATAESVVVVADEAEPVGVVMPITAPLAGGGMLDGSALETLTAPDGALTAQLEAAAGSEAILAVDPAIPAAIRALGDNAPLSAVEWLEDLILVSNDRFALQFGDADVAAQLQAGLSAPLQPLSLEGYVQRETAPDPSPTPTESPASVPDDETSELALEDLLDIGDAETSLYWPAPGHATADVIDGLRAADPEAVALTPSSATAEGADGGTVPAFGETAGGGVGLVYDAEASRAIDAVARTDGAQERDAAAAAASAELWFAGREAGDAPVLVALDRDLTTGYLDAQNEAEADAGAEEVTSPLGVRLSDALDVVTLSTAVDPQGLEDLLGGEPAAITPDETAPDEERVDFVAELADAEERVGVTATVLEQPETLTGLVRAEALQVLGVGWDGRGPQWRDVLGQFRENTRERANAVGIQDPEPVNLISAGANLPVWVRNDLPYPATVTLLARPTDPRLDVADMVPVTIQPRSVQAVQVPVEARVGSGDVDIELSLKSPTLADIGPRQTVEVTVRADWERIGIVVLGALVVGLIGIGIVRTVRRERRRRRPQDAAAPDGADTDSETQDVAGPRAQDAADTDRKDPDA
ncbi:DUF6049 family protein [Microbacterium sp. JZ31]|uniref:DUF6049 family protein n=1 Tax=Microbacterium sp. JZ31 TaxID=1906274 RepID=UPI0019340377|nr:DUF6049 family protein [Microbacterium sp. JZ31]